MTEAFRDALGRSPEGVWSAPGRINLIGEHTDYNAGCVLPFALPLRTAVAAGRRPDGLLTLRSCQLPGQPVTAKVESLAPGRVEGWAAYAAGVVWSFRRAGYEVGGLDLVVDGAVPQGSGLSSSAAMECAIALAAADLYDFDVEPVELARLAQLAENDFVGVPCGPMDQTVSLLARAGCALRFDTRSGIVEHIRFDPSAVGVQLLVIDTGVRHAHAGGAYAERRRECTEAAERLGVLALRDVLDDGLGDAMGVLADRPRLARRVRHVVTEQARTDRVSDLLRAGRVADIGPLLDSSHESLRLDFAVSCPELDTVVAAAQDSGALGARMTGGGFGGCAIALVSDQRAQPIREAVVAASAARGFPVPGFLLAAPSAGARRDSDRPTPSASADRDR